MMKVNPLISQCIIFFMLYGCSPSKQIKVLQFNIWQEGTMIDGGYGAIVDEIAFHRPDVVAFSEVRNYNGTSFSDRIVKSLSERGQKYFSFFSQDSGLLSKYPIKSSTVFPLSNDHGSLYKAVMNIDGIELATYTAHLDYLNCAYYLPRGYDGNTWEPLDRPEKNLARILEMNLASRRDEAIAAFVKDAKKEIDRGNLVIIGGDFNEPSHLDWVEETKNSFDHQGLVIPWHVSVLLNENGFADTYRAIYPNPVTHPGFTYPADCAGADIKELAWSPAADDRERIDRIYYYPTAGIELKKAEILGPKGSIKQGIRVMETSEDKFLEPLGIWPSDHKAILCTFKIQVE